MPMALPSFVWRLTLSASAASLLPPVPLQGNAAEPVSNYCTVGHLNGGRQLKRAVTSCAALDAGRSRQQSRQA